MFLWWHTRSPSFNILVTFIKDWAVAGRPTFHHLGVCDLTVAERFLEPGDGGDGEMGSRLARQIVPRRWCPGSRLEVSSWPGEPRRISKPCPRTKNDQHAGGLAYSVHLPPRRLTDHLLLHLSGGIGLGSCRLGLRPTGSLGQSSHPGPLLPHGLGLGLFGSLQQPPGPHWMLRHTEVRQRVSPAGSVPTEVSASPPPCVPSLVLWPPQPLCH